MYGQRQTNSRGQLTNRAGNQIERRRDVVPETMGSSQPTPQVGNLTGRTHDVILYTMAYSQLTSRVGNLNMNQGRCNIVPDPIASGSGM